MKDASDSTRKFYAAEQAPFMAEHGTPGVVGTYGSYQWLSMYERDMSELLSQCPQSVLGKYIAVTSIDGGALKLTEDEKAQGWWTSDQARFYHAICWSGHEYREDWKIAYSPRITSIHGLPNETHDECCAGFDEWYVFEQPCPPSEMEVFVNWGGFRLYDAHYQEWIDRLFAQLERLSAESYIADGTVLTFATRNASLFQNVIQSFAANPQPPIPH